MSESDYNTPPELLDEIRKLSRTGRIGLDPCSNRFSLVDAVTAYTKATNGLVHSWRGHGLVFMNPPHSQSPDNIEPWMHHAFVEFIDRPVDDTDQFVGLVPAKTDTAWFHNTAAYFDAKCFLRGRPRYWQGGKPTKGNGKFAAMLIYAGARVALFEQLFRPLGYVITARERRPR